jgi:small subunit ribosomal protein S16
LDEGVSLQGFVLARRTLLSFIKEGYLLKIRLSRTGSKKKPSYRVVVIEKSKARDGRFIDLLGHYNPKKNPAIVKLDREKYDYWVAKGAQPSGTVQSFLKTAE